MYCKLSPLPARGTAPNLNAPPAASGCVAYGKSEDHSQWLPKAGIAVVFGV